VNLSSHRGAKPIWNAEQACFLPGITSEPIFHAGSSAGIWDRKDCEVSGERAARQAINENEKSSQPGGWKTPILPLYEVRLPNQQTKAFVDFQHDVTGGDVRLAQQEGFVSVEHLKRYTTLGMATDQGKMGNVIGLALMADALGKGHSGRRYDPFSPALYPGRHWRAGGPERGSALQTAASDPAP
jgi:hypothetical protein